MIVQSNQHHLSSYLELLLTNILPSKIILTMFQRIICGVAKNAHSARVMLNPDFVQIRISVTIIWITSGYPFFLMPSHGNDPATGDGRRHCVRHKTATVTAAAVGSARADMADSPGRHHRGDSIAIKVCQLLYRRRNVR